MVPFLQNLLKLKPATQLIELCSRDEDKNGWKDVTKTARFDKPTLLLCSSASAWDEKRAAAEAAQITHFMGHIGMFTNPYNLYALSYSDLKRDIEISQAEMYGENALSNIIMPFNLRGDLSSQKKYFTDIVDTKLVPLVSGEDHTRLSLEEAKKRCSQLVMASYSYGGVAAEIMGNLLVEHMQQLHYTPEEIEDITKQIVHVSIGNVASLDKGKAAFTGYHLLNELDRQEVEHLSSITAHKEATMRKFSPNQNHLLMSQIPERESQMLIVTPTMATAEEAHETQSNDILIYNRRARMNGRFADDKKNLAAYFFNGTAHHYSDFIEYRLRGFGFVQPLLGQNILNNALSRSIRCYRDGFEELPSHEQIMSPPSVKIISETQHIDLEKIPGRQQAGEITQWTQDETGMYGDPQGVAEVSNFQQRLKASLANMNTQSVK